MTLLALVALLPMRHRRTPSLLRLLALLVEARLCGNDVSLDGVLFLSRLLRVTRLSRHHSIFFSWSIQSGTSHPLIFITFAIERSIGYLSLYLSTPHLVVFREQRNRHSLSTRASRSSHAVDVLNAALHLTPLAHPHLREVVVHHRVQPQEIQSTSQQIRCDEHPRLADSELVDGRNTRRMGQVRVDHVDTHIYASAHRLRDPLSYASSVYS